MRMMLLIQATWLSKLHDAQEKYQETLKSRQREGGESLAEVVDAPSHNEPVNITVGQSSVPVVPAHGDCRAGPSVAGAGRSWLNVAGTTSSLIVPSFAVHDYGELVRASYDVPPALSIDCISYAFYRVSFKALFPHVQLNSRFKTCLS